MVRLPGSETRDLKALLFTNDMWKSNSFRPTLSNLAQ